MKKTFISITLLFTVAIIINSCRKEVEEQPAPAPPTYGSSGGSTFSIALSGRVTDENKKPIEGVSILVGSKSVKTNALGLFYFDNTAVDDKRCIAQFSKAGFYNQSHAFIPKGSRVNYINVMMMERAAVQNFQAASG